MKHIQLRFLYIQEVIRAGAIELQRISTNTNPVDILTKPLDEARMVRCLQQMECWNLQQFLPEVMDDKKKVEVTMVAVEEEKLQEDQRIMQIERLRAQLKLHVLTRELEQKGQDMAKDMLFLRQEKQLAANSRASSGIAEGDDYNVCAETYQFYELAGRVRRLRGWLVQMEIPR
jgi:hypothetical protein